MKHRKYPRQGVSGGQVSIAGLGFPSWTIPAVTSEGLGNGPQVSMYGFIYPLTTFFPPSVVPWAVYVFPIFIMSISEC